MAEPASAASGGRGAVWQATVSARQPSRLDVAQSQGHVPPADSDHDHDHDEWVRVLKQLRASAVSCYCCCAQCSPISEPTFSKLARTIFFTNMDILPSGNIFRELQDIHDTGYFSAQPSLEDRWQQVSGRKYKIIFRFMTALTGAAPAPGYTHPAPTARHITRHHLYVPCTFSLLSYFAERRSRPL